MIRNPVLKKEMKTSGRGSRLLMVTMLFLGFLSVICIIAFYAAKTSSQSSGLAMYGFTRPYYIGMLTLIALLICLMIVPVLGAGIAGERERQTLEMLLASPQSHLSIIAGKWLHAILYALFLLLSASPVLAIAGMYGGLSLKMIFTPILYIAVLIMLTGSVSILCSVKAAKSSTAIIAAYSSMLFITFGTAMIVLMLYLASRETSSFLLYPALRILGYTWLINPAVTYVIVSGVLTDTDLPRLANIFSMIGIDDFTSRHWIVISVVVQLALTALLLLRSASLLGRSRTKRGKAEKNREAAADK